MRPDVPAPSRILIIRPSALGDVCRTVPVLAALRRAYPTARIDWLVQDTFADAIRSHPALTSAVLFPRREFGDLARRGRLLPILRWLSNLRRTRYDVVLDCQGLARSGLFSRWTGAPIRLGYTNAQELAWLGYTKRVYASRILHAVDRMMMLAEAAGASPVRDMRLYSAPADRGWLAADPRLAARPFAVLAPTSRWPAKRWPADRFADLARRLLDQRPGGIERVAIVGSAGERDQCAPLLDFGSRDERVVDLLGSTSVGQLMALIEAAALVVANDSAPLHMAVGFGRPLVALFGPTRKDRVGPYAREQDVVQQVLPHEAPDHKNESLGRTLMERITVDKVLDRAARSVQREAAALHA